MLLYICRVNNDKQLKKLETMLNLNSYLEIKAKINNRLAIATEKLNSFPKNGAGMVEFTPEYNEANRIFEIEFDNLRVLNVKAGKNILKEASKLRRAGWRS